MRYLILAFFSFFFSFGQENNEVPVYEYDVKYNLGKALSKKGYVINYDNNIHYSTSKSNFIEESKKESVDEFTGILNITFKGAGDGTESSISYADENLLIKKYSLGNQLMTTTEDLVTQNWKQTGTRKEVNGRDCIELVTSFRGRDYIAYVDLSVPIDYGPWKFNNFPGLPVLIFDSEKQLEWSFTGIDKKSEDSIKELIGEQREYLDSLKQVSLEEYVHLYDSSNNGFDLAVEVPEGFTRFSNNKKRDRGGLELMFEWEME